MEPSKNFNFMRRLFSSNCQYLRYSTLQKLFNERLIFVIIETNMYFIINYEKYCTFYIGRKYNIKMIRKYINKIIFSPLVSQLHLFLRKISKP